MNWHTQSIEVSLEALQTCKDTGLSQAEVQERLAQYGPNELVEKGGRTPLKIFWEQLTATMVASPRLAVYALKVLAWKEY